MRGMWGSLLVLLSISQVGWADIQEKHPDTSSSDPLASQANELTCFDFVGFRVVLRTSDEQAIRLFELPKQMLPNGLAIPDMAADELVGSLPHQMGVYQRPSLVKHAMHFDGVIWGYDMQHVAGQWFDAFFQNQSWRRFNNSTATSAFPASTKVMGRNDRFAWVGTGNSPIRIHRFADPNQASPASFKDVVRIFDYTTSPEEAFARLISRYSNGHFSKHTHILPDGTLRIERRFDPLAQRAHKHLFLTYHYDGHQNGPPDHWIKASIDPDGQRTRILNLLIRPTPNCDERFLPHQISEIAEAHYDVAQLESMAVRTNQLDIGNVRMRDDNSDLVDPRFGTIYILVNIAVAMVLLSGFYRIHLRYQGIRN